ncbi:hypothetical protein F4X10_11020 [Candidatus Poribacteria bacterium]|nr:hypothetical protein [Candidatus Poribacteria bacterium]
MKRPAHVFHTKHDFKPELGWAAFQLLSEVPTDGISPSGLHAISKVIGSPLAQRNSLTKLLASMQEVGIVEKTRAGVGLSKAGKALAKGLGCYEIGFRAAVHCLYAWKWIWDGDKKTASPSWSYREVLRQILYSGSVGVDSDEIVLRLVSVAEADFGKVKVSFSRASVSGVTVWLESQALPLVKKEGKRILCQNSSIPMADAIRLHLAALCSLEKGEIVLDDEKIQLLAESFLIQRDRLIGLLEDFARDTDEFLFISSVPNRVVFNGSEDPFIEWIVKEASGLNSEVSE